jgi:hypothetical protein
MVEIECLEIPKDKLENNKNNKLIKIKYDHKDGFLVISKDNIIKYLEEQKNLSQNEKILFRIRKSFKTGDYEAISPIKKQKINISEHLEKPEINKNEHFINYLSDKIWYPIKSSEYCDKENYQVIILNDDIIKLGKTIYFCTLFKEKSLINNDDNFNNNISNINKKSISILNIDINANQYKINNNKSNEKVVEVNRQQIKCLNENKNKISYESGRNETVSKSENRANTENEIYKYESENKTECWICLKTYSDKDNPLICLCYCHDYIHYKCLKKYFKEKINVSKNSKVTTYRCEQFNCYNCKKPYYSRFRIPEFNKYMN